MALKKVRIQLLNEETGAVEEEVDVLTSADSVKFEDGETLQDKLDSGTLKGPKGDTGAQGPQGPAGPAGADGQDGEPGAKGEQGEPGPAGVDGSAWLTGSSTPAPSSGKNGDFYLHTSNYDIYKKNSGAWEKIGNIKGAAGAKGETGEQGPAGADGQDGAPGAKGDPGNDGADGATWLFGTSAPSSQGKNGDFYLNTATFDVYQKSSNTWSKKGNIKGASGAKGDKGDKGDTGPAGPAGADGQDGDNVRVGTDYETAQQAKLFFKIIE